MWADHQRSLGETKIKCPLCREDFGIYEVCGLYPLVCLYVNCCVSRICRENHLKLRNRLTNTRELLTYTRAVSAADATLIP